MDQQLLREPKIYSSDLKNFLLKMEINILSDDTLKLIDQYGKQLLL